MIHFKPVTLTLGMLCFNIFSQTDSKKSNLSLSGSVDVYYTSNLYKDAKGTLGLLSDVQANGFGLGMVNTIASYEKEKIGAVADLAFGPRANSANAYDGAINQLYVYYKPVENLKFTLGQFNTFFGYEVISPTVNFNYTVSYLFSAGPFSHTGLRIDYNASDDVSLMLAITNPHGITTGSNSTNSYQTGFQIGYKKQYLNLIYGADGFEANDALLVDYTGGFNFSSSFYIGINAAYSYSNENDAGYKGVALYLQKEFKNDFALGFRPEFFSTTTTQKNLNQSAYTLTAQKTLSKELKMITEIRYDTSNDITFFNRNTLTGITVAAVYTLK